MVIPVPIVLPNKLTRMDPIKQDTEGYKLYLFTFVVLSLLTLFSVWLTHVRLAEPLIVGLIMIIATLQATIVLIYNMHLKFHEKILRVFVGGISVLIFFLIIVTMVDYIYR